MTTVLCRDKKIGLTIGWKQESYRLNFNSDGTNKKKNSQHSLNNLYHTKPQLS